MEEKTQLIFQYVIPAMVGSSVLTAFITQLFSYFSDKRSSNIEYITKEIVGEKIYERFV
ncbi:hypothetical protein ACYSNR_08440 [Enterococcus sp. LJL128]